MKWVVNRAGIKEELDIKKIREKLIYSIISFLFFYFVKSNFYSL